MYMTIFRSWRMLYGMALAVLVMGVLAASLANFTFLHSKASAALERSVWISLLTLLATFAFFTVIERLVPNAGPRKPLAGYVLNFNVTLLDKVFGGIFTAAVSASISALGSRYGLGVIDLRFHGNGFLAVLVAALVSTFIFDFFFYWFHRFQHESRFMWQEHKLHHMDEQLCAFYRQSWLESLLQGVAISIPTALLFRLNPQQAPWVGYAIVTWITFYHSNIRLHLGPLSAVFNCPQVHRIHHSRLYEHHDKNYAAFFPIWDILFGTYHHPKPGEFPPSGVHDEDDVRNFSQAALLPFREWHRMLQTYLRRNGNGEGDQRRVQECAVVEQCARAAIEIVVERGKTYWWCSCGLSKRQPFCDGSHKGTGHLPVRYEPKKTESQVFCVCKRTRTPPLCDQVSSCSADCIPGAAVCRENEN